MLPVVYQHLKPKITENSISFVKAKLIHTFVCKLFDNQLKKKRKTRKAKVFRYLTKNAFVGECRQEVGVGRVGGVWRQDN